MSSSRLPLGLVGLVMPLWLALGVLPGQATTTDSLRQLMASKIRPATRPVLSAALQAVLQMVRQPGTTVTRSSLQQTVPLDASHMIDVFVYTTPLTDEHLQTLQGYGGHLHHLHRQSTHTLVYASLPIENVEAVAREAFVTWMTPALRGVRRTGRVTSAGAQAMRADVVQSLWGVDGSGVRIGIISDSLADLQASVVTGDLPPDVVIVNGKDGSNDPTAVDEGRAMAEIIHDLAPGATILFHSGFPTHLDMIAAIEALTLAGADIIVDDLGFLNEPVFEDGPVAQAVQAAIDSGVLYVAAAGNNAMNNYRAPYREFAPNDDAQLHLHDFGNLDTTMAVRIRPGSFLLVVLQWPDPFDGSSNTADYDLLLLDASGSISACAVPGIQGFCSGLESQLDFAIPPSEVVMAQNTTLDTVTVNVAINRSGGVAKPLQLLFSGGITVVEHNVSRYSIFGHPCVREALAVGAANVATPAFDTLEPFSAQGPCALFLPEPDIRFKPDVVGADGVDTTIQPLFAPFFGTSAAAPHVAAVAALLMELAGGPQAVSPTRIADVMRLAAVDQGVPGADRLYGYGIVDAERAAALLQSQANTAPESVIVSPSDDIVVTPGQALSFQGLCIDAQDEGTFAFAWDFASAAAPAAVQSPGPITFNDAGVFPITFICSDADGLSDATPAVRLVTVNHPPQSRITSPGDSVRIAAGSRLDFMGVCEDPEHHVPFTYLWFFDQGADISHSTEPNPRQVRFPIPGDFDVSFTCRDALGTAAPHADVVRVLVSPLVNSADSGGGGGCSLRPVAAQTPVHPLEAIGNLGLSLLILVGLRVWRRWRGQR